MGTHSDGKRVTIGGFSGSYFDKKYEEKREVIEIDLEDETIEWMMANPEAVYELVPGMFFTMVWDEEAGMFDMERIDGEAE